jgi:hypothetical protein
MTENELLQELTRMITRPPIEPDEVTVQMLQVSSGKGEKAAMRFLRDLEAEGALTSRQVTLPNGRIAQAWRKAIAEVE